MIPLEMKPDNLWGKYENLKMAISTFIAQSFKIPLVQSNAHGMTENWTCL